MKAIAESLRAEFDMEFEIQTVTPDVAKSWLGAARISDHLNRQLVESYARDMENDDWKLNGDPIIFDINGVLLSGRHRLKASVLANAKFRTLVVRGVNEKDFETIDSVRRRTVADIMNIRKEPHYRALAAALALVWRAANDDFWKQYKRVSSQEQVAILDRNPTIRRSVEKSLGAAPEVPHGMGAALHFLFQNEDRLKADEFFAKLAENEQHDGCPATALKRQLRSELDRGGRRQPVQVLALCVKAWNAFREGKETSYLRFVLGNDGFPDIPGVGGIELGEAKVIPKARNSGSQSELSVAIELAEITPDEAEGILERNDRNRGIAGQVVDKYARDMKAGNWALNGQTIKIGKSGRLLDGQHRLSACIKSGVPFKAILVQGLDEDVFDTFDLGAARSLSAILGDRGEINTALLAGTLRKVWLVEMEVATAKTIQPSVNELLDALEKHPGIRDSVKLGRKLKQIGPPSQLCALHYWFAVADRKRADEFFDRLTDGASLMPGHPILPVRDNLLRDKFNSKRTMSDAERMALVIKAWNLVSEGKTAKQVKWINSGDRREPFPRIFGLEIGGTCYDRAA